MRTSRVRGYEKYGRVSRGRAERMGCSRNEHRNQGHNYKWGLIGKEYAYTFTHTSQGTLYSSVQRRNIETANEKNEYIDNGNPTPIIL